MNRRPLPRGWDAPLEAREPSNGKSFLHTMLAVAAVMIPGFATSTGVLIAYLDMRYVQKSEYVEQRASIIAAANTESSDRKAADAKHDQDLAVIEERLRAQPLRRFDGP